MPSATPKLDQFSVSLTLPGATSKRKIKVTIESALPGEGICFRTPGPGGDYVQFPAHVDSVVNTMRNVVLGKDGTRLCIVEHVLAAIALWGLEDVTITVDGPELPLGDGSACFYLDLLEKSGVARGRVESTVAIEEPITVTNKDRTLMIVPDDKFSITYLMDWNHPKIGKRWSTWDASMDPREVAKARTFASLKEHQLLGLDKDLVSMTEDGFTYPLHFEDEPVRHKLLDLIGDLTLIGMNPMKLKARVISIKGGHELDVRLARSVVDVLMKRAP